MKKMKAVLAVLITAGILAGCAGRGGTSTFEPKSSGIFVTDRRLPLRRMTTRIIIMKRNGRTSLKKTWRRITRNTERERLPYRHAV